MVQTCSPRIFITRRETRAEKSVANESPLVWKLIKQNGVQCTQTANIQSWCFHRLMYRRVAEGSDNTGKKKLTAPCLYPVNVTRSGSASFKHAVQQWWNTEKRRSAESVGANKLNKKNKPKGSAQTHLKRKQPFLRLNPNQDLNKRF